MLNINSNQILTREEVKQIAPSVFTDHALEKMSDKYTHLSTAIVIDDMEKLGWNVIAAAEIKARKRMGYQKHMLVFRNPEVNITSEDGDVVYPLILVTNSHDGTSTFVFRCSIFRLICENNLVISSRDFTNLKIRHMGYSFEELQKCIQEIANSIPNTIKFVNRMIEKSLTPELIEDFTKKAVDIRHAGTIIEVNVKDIINPVRFQDTINNVWGLFNVVEEKLIKGDYNYINDKGKLRKARPIKNFIQDIKINEQLWELAESYL